MITDKQQALEEINKRDVNFDDFDKRLLRDKDVALAYMQHHSSNNMLVGNFPIDIDNVGMIDDIDFILQVIKNLDVGYNKGNLMTLIKYSTSCIIKSKMTDKEDWDKDELKQLATQILTTYNDNIKARKEELNKKQSLLDEVNSFIDQAELDSFDEKEKTAQHEKYKRCDIGFTAEF